MTWLHTFFHAVLCAQVVTLLVLQILDVHSTILALRLPWVIEVGDTDVGLGNVSGFFQRHCGPVWWIMKAPFLTYLPMLWVPIDVEVQFPIIMLMILAIAYFHDIVTANYRNAKSQPPLGWKPESPTPSRSKT